MGQQQLLLIVLGIILVGIAIVVGIGLFNSNSEQSNRDAIVGDLNNIAVMALSYYKKPASMGGGGNSFTGWKLPPDLKTNSNGSFTITVKANNVKIVGTGTEKGSNAKKSLKFTATVTASSINIKQNN